MDHRHGGPGPLAVTAELARELARGDSRLVVVGAGIAGVQAAAAARKAGFDGEITLIGEERGEPYDRPTLSKQVLQQVGAEAKIALRPGAFYADNRIDLMAGRRVAAIDRARRRLEFEDGGEAPYTALILATGSRPRILAGFEPGRSGLFYLRDLEHSLALRAALGASPRLVLIGGGIIGLEVAAAAAKVGAKVTVIEAAERVLTRAASPTLAEHLAAAHRERDVEILTGVTAIAREHGGQGWRLELSDGRRIEADIVLVGVGVAARTELAAAAGLAVGPDGVAADAFGATSDARIFAAGEAAWHFNAFRGRQERQENWFHAAAHGEHVGHALFGPAEPYDDLGGYWTDQYDVHLQTAGTPIGDTDVVRGDMAGGKFIIYHLEGGVVIGASAVNTPRELRMAKTLIRERARHDPRHLADPSFDLSKVAA